MTLLSPAEFRALSMGVDVSALTGGPGDVVLALHADRALAKIEDYIGTPLHFHQVPDEEAPVLDAALTVFPQRSPIRGVQAFDMLLAASGGSRRTISVKCSPVERPRRGANPKVFGDVVVNRDQNSLRVSSYAALMGLPWMALGRAQSSTVLVTYTAGFDDQGDTALLSDTVQTALTQSQFTVSPGVGALIQLGVPLSIGGTDASVLSVSGDLVTLTGPLGTMAPGLRVTQSDGVVMPPPTWLKELIRDVMWHNMSVASATEIGANVMTVQVGEIRYSMPARVDPLSIPQNVKDSLDLHLGVLAAELA